MSGRAVYAEHAVQPKRSHDAQQLFVLRAAKNERGNFHSGVRVPQLERKFQRRFVKRAQYSREFFVSGNNAAGFEVQILEGRFRVDNPREQDGDVHEKFPRREPVRSTTLRKLARA